MKKKSKVITGLICGSAMAISVVVTGCSGSSTGEGTTKTTAETQKEISSAKELASELISKLGEVESQHADMDMTLKGTMKVMGYDLNMDMDISIDSDTNEEADNISSHAVMEQHMKMTGLDKIPGGQNQEQSSKNEIYTVKGDSDKYTTYSSTDGGAWTKNEVTVPGVISQIDAEFFQNIADGKTEAKFESEGEQVNGSDVYRLDTQIKGEEIGEIYSAIAGTNDAYEAMGLGDLNLDNIKTDVTIYVYKDSLLPAKMVMDAKELGEQLMSQMMGQALGSTDMEVNIDDYLVEAVYTQYNEVAPITVPSDVIEAAGK